MPRTKKQTVNAPEPAPAPTPKIKKPKKTIDAPTPTPTPKVAPENKWRSHLKQYRDKNPT